VGAHNSTANKEAAYVEVCGRIRELIRGEVDEIAVLSTVVCELHNSFSYFDWTGFYRVYQPGVLKVGPYQGKHGCLTIPFSRGVCGKCATTREIQLVSDVRQLPYHIACSSTTLSEIVVPVTDARGSVRAVLDVDSDRLGAFDEADAAGLREVCAIVSRVYS